MSLIVGFEFTGMFLKLYRKIVFKLLNDNCLVFLCFAFTVCVHQCVVGPA